MDMQSAGQPKMIYDIILGIKGVSKIIFNIYYKGESALNCYGLEEIGMPYVVTDKNYINEDSTGIIDGLQFSLMNQGSIIFESLTIEYSETQCRLMSY